MDRLDLALIRELMQGSPGFAVLPAGTASSLRGISRRLGVSEGTIRNRLRALRRSGFFEGFRLIPNPELLGLEMGAFSVIFSHNASREAATDRLSETEGFVVVQEHYGAQFGGIFLSEGNQGRERVLRLVAHLSGSESVVYGRLPFPLPQLTPSSTDWRLLANLVRYGPRPLATICRDLGRSPRTVHRRLARLAGANAFFSLIQLNYSKLDGGAPADLIVTSGPDHQGHDVTRRLLALLEPYMFYAGLWEGLQVYSVIIPNPLSIRHIKRAAAAIPNVGEVHLELVVNHIEPREQLRKYLLARIESQLRSPPDRTDSGKCTR